jgi:hypothetical protein
MISTYLCHHFHCDPIFTCPQSVHIEESVELARQYVAATLADPNFACVLSEIDYMQGYANIYVEDRQAFLGLLRDNRIETSGSYSEPNENSIGGEALLRNVVYGQWWLVDCLGGRGDVYLPFDVFGHVRQLPQILSKCGFIGASWTKGSGRLNRDNYELSTWCAPDGSRILNKIASYGRIDWECNDQFEGLDRIVRAGGGGDLAFRGADFVSPPSWVAGRAEAIQHKGVAISQPSAYFTRVQGEHQSRTIDVPVTAREMSLYHSGTALSHSDLKIASRLAEETVAEAETWAAIATLFGESYPEAGIDRAWRQLLFCQHHDSITGTSNDQSYLDLMSHLREALAEADDARQRAVSALAARVDTEAGDGIAVVVFNSLNIVRTETVDVKLPPEAPAGDSWTVEDEDGNPQAGERADSPAGPVVRFVARNIPGVGYRTFWISPAEVSQTADDQRRPIVSDSQPVTVETRHAIVTFDPERGGGITSLTDRQTGVEIAGSEATPSCLPLNDVVRLKEGPGKEPSWEYHTTGDRLCASSMKARVAAVPTVSGWEVEISCDFPDTDGIVRRLRLYDDDPRIDCRVEIRRYSGSRLLGRDRIDLEKKTLPQHQLEDPEDRDMFGLLFPVGLSGVSPRWSDRFSSRVIRRSVGWLDFRTHQDKFYSGSGLYSADQWIAATPDVSLVLHRDGEPTARAIPLGMVRVVFADTPEHRKAAELLVQALCRRGITATPYVDSEDQHNDLLQTDQIIALGGARANRLVASQDHCVGIDDPRFVRDIILGGEEKKRVPLLIVQSDDMPSTVAELVDELEGGSIDLPTASVVSESIVEVGRAGLAILNRGTIAASCEPDGSLYMALQHSTGWCDWATPLYLGHPFVPERKTSIFHYAIMPLSGNWIESKVPERAAGFNRPLTVVTEQGHTGVLASSLELVTLRGRGALLSALKPVGQQSAQFVSRTMDARKGTVARFWNWNGSDDAVKVDMWTGVERVVVSDPTEKKLSESPALRSGSTFAQTANSVDTLMLYPGVGLGGGAPHGNLKHHSQMAYCRWWRHNTGAAPVGNLPASVTLRGELFPGCVGEKALVAVANNMADSPLVGEVTLSCQDSWSIVPKKIEVDIAAGAGALYPVQVAIPAGSPGRLEARLVVAGVTYTDTLTAGEAAGPEVRVVLQGDDIVVHLANPTPDRLRLTLTLISPMETWSEALGAWPISYREEELELASEEDRMVSIPAPDGFLENSWAFIKIAAGGSTTYVRVPTQVQTRAIARPDGTMTLSAPLADLSLRVTAEDGVRARITRWTEPPQGCNESPVPGVRKYWTIGDVVGRFTGAEIEAGIVPTELGALRNVEVAKLAYWTESGWKAVRTRFDPGHWVLRCSVPDEVIDKESVWTIVGESDVLWRTHTGGRFFDSAPWVGDLQGNNGTDIVIGTPENQVVALSSQGSIRWRRSFGGWIWPSVRFGCADLNGDGRREILVSSSDERLTLLDAAGATMWERDDLPFAHKSTPVFADVDGDGALEIIVSVQDHGVWAFDGEGGLLWRTESDPVLLSRPAVLSERGGTTIFVNAGGKRLIGYTGGGEQLYERVFAQGPASERRAAEPVVSDRFHPGKHEIVFGGHDGKLRLLDLDGTQVWEVDAGGPIIGAPAVLDRVDGAVVVCATGEGVVLAVSCDGVVLWKYDAGASIQGDVVVADVDGDGRLEIVVGATPSLKTYVLRTTGELMGVIAHGSIWSNTPALMPIPGACGSALVIGGADGYVTSVALPAQRIHHRENQRL